MTQYLTAVRGKCAELPEAYRGEGFRSLSEIYTAQFLEERRESSDSDTLTASLTQTRHVKEPATIADAERRKLFELIDKAAPQHVVIEGGPGAGKSTLLRYFAHELASRWLAHEPVRYIPVLIPAGAFSAGLDRPLSALLHSAVTTTFGAEWQDAMLPPRLFAAAPARNTPWLVLVDGLDTVQEPSERQRIVTAIQNRDAGGVYRFVLTSRPIDELRVGAQSSMSSYRLLPFDPSALSAFAKAWFKSDPARSDSFVAALSQSTLSELGRLPLLATVAASIFERDKGLRGTRSTLYEEFVELMLRLKPEQRQSAREVLRGLKASWSESLDRLAAAHVLGDIGFVDEMVDERWAFPGYLRRRR